MANSKNAVSLIGRLGADPELKTFDNGGVICNLRVATSQTWKDKDGEKQERTEWHQVVIKIEGVAKAVDKYLRKGDRIGIEGMLQTRKWKDKDDNERYSVEVVVPPFGGEVIFMNDNKRDDDGRDADDRGGRSGSNSRGRDDRGGGRGDDRSSRSSGRGRDDDRGGDDRGGRGRDNRDDDRGGRGGNSSSARGGGRSAPSRDNSDMDDDIPF